MKVEYTNKFTLIDWSNAKHTWQACCKSASFHDQIARIKYEICVKRCARDKGFKGMETKYLINYFLIQEAISTDQLKMLPVVELWINMPANILINMLLLFSVYLGEKKLK